MLDSDTYEVIIFDSCAYWGHDEADLGTWRAARDVAAVHLSGEKGGNTLVKWLVGDKNIGSLCKTPVLLVEKRPTISKFN